MANTSIKARSYPYLTGQLFDGIASSMLMLAVPWAMLSEPGNGPFVALTALICTAMSFVATPFSSTMIDRLSRKSILLATQTVKVTAAMITFLLFISGNDSIWVLAVFQIVFWVVNDVAWVNHNAFIQENYQTQEYPIISGHREVVMQGTSLTAGMLGILLLESWTIIEFSAVASLLSIIALTSYWQTPYQQKIRRSSRQAFFSQLLESKNILKSAPGFFAFVALSSLSYPVLTFLVRLVPIYLAELGVDGAWFASWNMAFAIGGLLMGFSVNMLLKRIDHQNAMIVSVLVISTLLLMISTLLSPLILVAFTVGIGFFNAFNRIARTNLLHVSIPIKMRGRVDGGLKLFTTTAQSISYVVIALLSSYDMTQSGFMMAGLIMLLAGLAMISLKKKPASTVTSFT
ncbi:MFS transporter [Veronia pacifica]|uniref:MFS transporter n=1 Tax=Veronia pacifica TaxID=1080227 RepID=A0A1C3EPC6_9GAMM|nr:MFS transporter [Veronia pacifica]ODA35097.1 MFS transporter [Veronia pacifica]